MNVNISQYSLYDILAMLERKEMVINRDYQRSGGIWPDSARSYFIDTILEEYPFPKIYLYQTINEKTSRPIKEIIDGQQRITTIQDFFNNKFAIGVTSAKYAGMKYEDLDEEQQRRFQSYQIEASIVLNANRIELFEMFRRMNAYTAPLSKAELRHSTYQGNFKWFIVDLADKISPILEDFKVFTPKQLARMHDSEFLSELILLIDKGITSKSQPAIESLYKKYNIEFEDSTNYEDLLMEFFNFLKNDLSPLKNTTITKSYVIYSLFSAFLFIKGKLIIEDFECIDHNISLEDKIRNLAKLAEAHELVEEDGEFREYVIACSARTTNAPQRIVRTQYLVKALTGNI